MSAKSDPREVPAGSAYFYRRSLSARDLLPALGVGLAAGLVAFYLTHIVLQRTPLTAEGLTPRRRARLRGAAQS